MDSDVIATYGGFTFKRSNFVPPGMVYMIDGNAYVSPTFVIHEDKLEWYDDWNGHYAFEKELQSWKETFLV